MLTQKPKPTRTSLADSAYQRIREDVLLCTLEPGAEVTETELAARYDLGKAPIRAALQRLAQEGLVQALPRRGHLIAPITLRDIQEIFELRMLIEPPMAAKAAGRVTDTDVERLKELTHHGATVGVPFQPANTEFHLLPIEVVGNRRVRDTVIQLLDQLERVANLQVAETSWDELLQHHEKIINAFERRDAEAAARAVAEHIKGSRKSITDAIFESERFLSVEIGRR